MTRKPLLEKQLLLQPKERLSDGRITIKCANKTMPYTQTLNQIYTTKENAVIPEISTDKFLNGQSSMTKIIRYLFMVNLKRLMDSDFHSLTGMTTIN